MMSESNVAVYRLEVRVEAIVVLFFFQAEDGIRDLTVTGVQTCALPILFALWQKLAQAQNEQAHDPAFLRNRLRQTLAVETPKDVIARSEERRVGKECRSRWSADH